MDFVRWGILGTAKIAREAILPALQEAKFSRVEAIASREVEKANGVGETFSIPKVYGGYDELLADSAIDAVYIPLPNHLHVEWTIKALEQGKHVLCEKPLSPAFAETQKLYHTARDLPHLNVMEAFMYKFHAQWLKVKELIQLGEIGEIQGIQSAFSFFDSDPKTIVNNQSFGGGSLLDIGCYSVSVSRLLFQREPRRVCASMDFDPTFKTDRLTSGILDFGPGTSTFICSTQADDYQHVTIFGTKGSLEMELPFNPPDEETWRIWLGRNGKKEEISFAASNQYMQQFDVFSKAILDGIVPPIPLEESLAQAQVIEALFTSAREGGWVVV